MSTRRHTIRLGAVGLLSVLAFGACQPASQPLPYSLEDELQFYADDKDREYIGSNLRKAAEEAYANNWLFVSTETARADRWMIWQSIGVGHGVLGSIRFIYRDASTHKWALRDFLWNETRSMELSARAVEALFETASSQDEFDSTHSPLHPTAWYLTIYNGKNIVRKAAMVDALGDAYLWDEELPSYDGVYKNIADLVNAVRSVAPWGPGKPAQDFYLDHTFRVWLNVQMIKRPAPESAALHFFQENRDYFDLRMMSATDFVEEMRRVKSVD